MAECVGFFELGRSYANSADLLSDAARSGNRKINRMEPIDFLYAHAVELMLKGCKIHEDPDSIVESYGHDLLRLYDDVKTRRAVDCLIPEVEKSVRERWKCHLRDARDIYAQALGLEKVHATELDEFGVYSNEVIGQELPGLRDQIIWLTERHRDAGSEFRYHRMGLDRRQQVRAFGLSDDIVWLSLRWACQDIYRHFRRVWANRRK